MGCGISTLDVEDSPMNQRANKVHEHANARAVIESKKDFENGEQGDATLSQGNNNHNHNHNHNNKDVVVVMRPISGDEEVKTMKEDESNGKMLKEKCIVERNEEEEKVLESGGKEKYNGNDKHAENVKNIEDEHEFQDDSFIGPGSPSFRDYCNEYYDSGARISAEDSNDCESGESIKNFSDDDSSNRKKKPKNEESANSNKEAEKKERRGRGFRNVINKRKTKGRRNLLNFVCYNNPNNESAKTLPTK